MPGFLERYGRGEREAVWTELAALGGRVREPGTYDDAVAVARETMRRARHNIGILIPRLHQMEYNFTYPQPLEPPARNTAAAAPADARFPFEFAPDELHKANISGATYDVMLPDPAADFRLLGARLPGEKARGSTGDPWFVAYLRNSFAWGGFPGWAGHKNAPLREIEFLTKDLLPL